MVPGLLEILIVFLVLGGLAFALRGRPAARTWLLGGLACLFAGGVVLLVLGGLFVSRTIEHRSAAAPRAFHGDFHRGEELVWVERQHRGLNAEAVGHDVWVGEGPAHESRIQHVEFPQHASRPGESWSARMAIAPVIAACLVAIGLFVGVFLFVRSRLVQQRPSFWSWVLGGMLGVFVCGGILLTLGTVYSLRAQRIDSDAQIQVQALRTQHDETAVPYSAEIGEARAAIDANGISSWMPMVAPKPGPPAEPLPDWVTAERGDSNQTVVVGSQFATRDEAFADAINKAESFVWEGFRVEHPRIDRWSPHSSVILNTAVRERHTRQIVRSAGEHDFTVHRTYLLVDRSPAVMDRLEPIWRRQVTQQRSIQVGVIAAILTGIAGLLAGFFRLDDRTRGRYRWPLIGATGVGIALLASVPVLADQCIANSKQRYQEPELHPHELPQQMIIMPAPCPHRLINNGQRVLSTVPPGVSDYAFQTQPPILINESTTEEPREAVSN